VICRLGERPHRFNELRRAATGITQRMLTSTLRGLERDGVVSRTVHPTTPPRVEYALPTRAKVCSALCKTSVTGQTNTSGQSALPVKPMTNASQSHSLTKAPPQHAESVSTPEPGSCRNDRCHIHWRAGDLDLAATLPLPLGMAGREEAPAVASRPVAPGTNPEPEITVDFVGSITNAAKVIASLHVGEKRLVFVGRRRRAEELAAALREHGIEPMFHTPHPRTAERRRSEMHFARHATP